MLCDTNVRRKLLAKMDSKAFNVIVFACTIYGLFVPDLGYLLLPPDADDAGHEVTRTSIDRVMLQSGFVCCL